MFPYIYYSHDRRFEFQIWCIAKYNATKTEHNILRLKSLIFIFAYE